MGIKTFKDLEFKVHPNGMGGIQAVMEFDNGHRISVVGGSAGLYGNGITTFETVYVCAYKIDTRAMIPFIQYLLYKNNTLSFPSFKYTNSPTIINDTIVLLSFLFKSPSIDCTYKGHLTMDEVTQFMGELQMLGDDIPKSPLGY